ncbi:hypothetical protein DFJ74DRAFT_689562 [Hyaloraphidium curvatum]|nr:hypothetical protein DFJ74DRAFT_689562 [Hyaloraphidium curvatum]
MKVPAALLAALAVAALLPRAAAHDYDPDAFYRAMCAPSRFHNHIVYAPPHAHADWALGETLVLDGAAAPHGDPALHRRDALLDTLDHPSSPRRVIRSVPGCPGPAGIAVSPAKLDAGAVLELALTNVPAFGIDFGEGIPDFTAFWNASLLEINGAATTTLTETADTLTTAGAAFPGCFAAATVSITARRTQTGEDATFTPDVTGRYFVDATISPGLQSTRFPFQITTTKYTFTPPPGYLPPPTEDLPTPTPTFGGCLSAPRMTATTSGFPIYRATPGNGIRVTLLDLPETIAGTAGGKTTWAAAYSAGEVRYISTGVKTTKGAKTRWSTTVTVVTGRMVTATRVVATPPHPERDGCVRTHVDSTHWVAPTAAVEPDEMLLLGGSAAGFAMHGGAMMPLADTTLVTPTAPHTHTTRLTCGHYYAAVSPTAVTPGQVMTLQLYNVPHTHISMAGFSTVFEARYAATVLSNHVGIGTVPTRTVVTTMPTPQCLNVSATMTFSAATQHLPLQPAPSPTQLYQVRVAAHNHSAPQEESASRPQIFVNRGANTPDSVMLRPYPCLVGPLRTVTTITWNRTAPFGRTYQLNRTVRSGTTTWRLSWQLGSRKGGRMTFVARDGPGVVGPAGGMNLYETSLANLPRPADWAVEWTATGSFVGRTMPPFTVNTTYLADFLLHPNGTRTRTRASVRAFHAVRIVPRWAMTPKGAQPSVRFDVTSPTMGGHDALTLTCAHRGARRSAFQVVPVGVLKGAVAPSDFAGPTTSYVWTFVGLAYCIRTADGCVDEQPIPQNTGRSGRWVPRFRPALSPRWLGPIAEAAERFAVDGGDAGDRLDGEPNPNAPEGAGTADEVMRELAAFRQVGDP